MEREFELQNQGFKLVSDEEDASCDSLLHANDLLCILKELDALGPQFVTILSRLEPACFAE